ncbi:hypoxanthine/guanine phosphoribosyltransferase [Methanospirillum stamsii]|uniref:Hypoxanthine/guanine phosphoribosyltransferase n=1 Tax=Methanospirillum stamsii TaxID=1277351 RepID=A0A2V2NCR7_9EURY|nr:hypoxanthine/guanine phosphoribosyltransferase [Methanospirillum stamsii]PWR75406.1 adenine phosphoribosyltransferase [Methanospirillum stamsii]
MYPILTKSLITCPIVKKGEYNYFVHPITDGVPDIHPDLLREIAVGMIRLMNLENVKYIVTAEAMGIPIGTVLSLMTDIPLNIIRKRKYGLPGECDVCQVTGYSKGEMYINGINPGDRIVLIDDVISTGGTMNGIITALQLIGAEIVDIGFVIKKGSPDLILPYSYLVSIEVTDSVRIVDQTT